MPGICGVAEFTPSIGPFGAIVRAMQDELAPEDGYVRAARTDNDARVALASVALGHGSQRAKLAWDAVTGNGVVLDGELYDAQPLADRLRSSGLELADEDHAAILLAGYTREGKAFLRRLHGSFAAALWEGSHRRLTLLTDRFGTRPVYYQRTDGSVRFASGLAALLAGDSSPRRVAPRGLAQFFTFGHYLRDDTSLQDVRILPAAACFTCYLDNDLFKPDTYWSITEATIKGSESPREWLASIDEALVAAVRRRTSDAPHLGLSLSGGLDARTILGLIDVSQSPLTSVCLGMRGSLDHRSSAQLSKIAGCTYHAHVLDGAFLSRFREHLERMVQLTDGQYLSQCIVIPTLPVYRELGIQTLLRGHGGELMHMRKAYNYSLDDAAMNIRTSAQLRGWLFQRLQAYLLDGVSVPLFRPLYQDGLHELAAQSLDEDLVDVAHVEQPLARIWHLFLSQRLRREMALSMFKFRSVVEPRLPYLDNDLIPILLSAPLQLKLGEDIQCHILRRHRPEFLGVVNANTGARVGAGHWIQRVATFQMKVLAKLGARGYQPYERLGLWLRRELASTVRDILLDRRTLERGVFHPDGIKTVVRQHLEQGHNHTFLLMALMIFELGLRRLLDSRTCHDVAAGADTAEMLHGRQRIAT